MWGCCRRSAGRPVLHDAPLLQHVGAVGDVERLQHVLLDQQHRGAVLAHAGDDLEHVVDDGRRQAERRLVEQHEARAAPSAPGRSPPSAAGRPRARRPAGGACRAGWGTARRRARAIRWRWRARRRAVAAELEVLLDRHLGEQPAPLGHERDAVAAIAVRRAPASCRRRRSAARPLRQRSRPGDGVDQRGLAARRWGRSPTRSRRRRRRARRPRPRWRRRSRHGGCGLQAA